jgi:hypothetical protein
MCALHGIDAALNAAGLSPDKIKVEKVCDTPMLKATPCASASDANSVQRFMTMRACRSLRKLIYGL